MEKQFVTYEIALKLKELGFNEECLMYWNDFGQTSINRFQLLNKIDEWNQNYIEAPLWQQVVDWFRLKYRFHIVVEFELHWKWFYYINLSPYTEDDDNLTVFTGVDGFKSYEKAREQAILKAIEIKNNDSKN